MDAASQSFIHLLRQRAVAAPAAPFGDFEGRVLTFADIDRMSDAVASELRARGVSSGDRVAVMLRNGPISIAMIFGLAKAGAVWVPINTRQKGEGLAYVLTHCAPCLVVAESDVEAVLRDCGATLPALLLNDATGLEAIVSGPAHFDEPLPDPSSLLAIMYTSGTTGPPKGVCVTHRMLHFAARGVLWVAELHEGDRLFVWEPFFHIGGAQILLLPLMAPVTLAMVASFSASRFWDMVIDAGATHIHYLGGVLQALLLQPERPRDRTHGVRIAWGGGCPIEAWRPFAERFGVEIRECYGMTETSSIATCNTLGVAGSVGRPAPWFDVRVVNDTGAAVVQGEAGIIAVREREAGSLFSGYFKAENISAAAFRDGWFLTGDLGLFDEEGNLFFKGRATDSVRCKGENVSAWEVESITERHPAVEACAMIGVKATVGEQDIKLFVQLKSGTRIDPAELCEWLSARLAPWQVPRYVKIVEGFERTPSQRIMKHRLSAALDDCWDRQASLRAPATRSS